MLKYLVTIAFSSLSTKGEADDVAKFFEGKDTSLYNMGLAQTLETVYTKAAWLEVSETMASNIRTMTGALIYLLAIY